MNQLIPLLISQEQLHYTFYKFYKSIYSNCTGGLYSIPPNDISSAGDGECTINVKFINVKYNILNITCILIKPFSG